jgi:hypothetical protein
VVRLQALRSAHKSALLAHSVFHLTQAGDALLRQVISGEDHAGRKAPVLTVCRKTYAGTMRMLRSTAWGECVRAPTEM